MHPFGVILSKLCKSTDFSLFLQGFSDVFLGTSKSSFAHPYGMQKVGVVCFTDSKSLWD